MESIPKTSYEPESKDSVQPGLEEPDWMFDKGLSSWAQNVEDKVEFLSNDRTRFILDQANIWCRKLGEERGGLEVKTEDCLEQTFFVKFSDGSNYLHPPKRKSQIVKKKTTLKLQRVN